MFSDIATPRKTACDSRRTSSFRCPRSVNLLAVFALNSLLSGCIEVNGQPLPVALVGTGARSIQETVQDSSLSYVTPVGDLFDRSGARISVPSTKAKEQLKSAVATTISMLVPAFEQAYKYRTSESEINEHSPSVLRQVQVAITDDQDTCTPSASVGDPAAHVPPTLFVPWCFFQSGVFVPALNEGDLGGDALGNIFAGAIQEVSKERSYMELREELLFVVGHELTHIWLHDEDTSRTPDKEIRADSWGVITSMSVSPAASAQAKSDAELLRTGHTSTSGPYEIALLGTDYGASAVFQVYEHSTFAHGDNAHMPIKDRLTQVNQQVSQIFSSQVDRTKLSDIVLWHAGNELFPDIVELAAKTALGK